MDNDMLNAIQEDPEGEYCSRCLEQNDWCDDCGWFYSPFGAVCKNCWDELGLNTCER
jgi:hypothetical protein